MVEALTVRDERDVSKARQYVLDQGRASGLDFVCDDAALLTSELVTTAARHAPRRARPAMPRGARSLGARSATVRTSSYKCLTGHTRSRGCCLRTPGRNKDVASH